MTDGFEKENPATENKFASRKICAGVYCGGDVAVWSSISEQAAQISIPNENQADKAVLPQRCDILQERQEQKN